MKKKSFLAAALLACSLGLTGCGIFGPSYASKMDAVSYGAKKNDILRQLRSMKNNLQGTEFYKDKEGNVIETLVYRHSQYQGEHLLITYTYLIFKDGMLVEKRIVSDTSAQGRKPSVPTPEAQSAN
ncbi:MAG: hypothetical protein Q3998_03080 [Porphyromonas sp.]|nr:hypothetical protein [Porphyromonas sp.]